MVASRESRVLQGQGRREGGPHDLIHRFQDPRPETRDP